MGKASRLHWSGLADTLLHIRLQACSACAGIICPYGWFRSGTVSIANLYLSFLELGRMVGRNFHNYLQLRCRTSRS